MIEGLLHERFRDGLHQKLTILNSCNVGAELGVVGELGLPKNFLGKEFELRKAFCSIKTGTKKISYTCLSLPAPIMI